MKTLRELALSGELTEAALVKLLETGSSINQQVGNGATLLHHVIRHRHTETAMLFVQYGADVTKKDQDGNTPLHEAARKNDVSLVQCLLFAGADINAKDILDRNAQKIAQNSGSYTVVPFLDPTRKRPLIVVEPSFFSVKEEPSNPFNHQETLESSGNTREFSTGIRCKSNLNNKFQS
jgi:hypothetical protein